MTGRCGDGGLAGGRPRADIYEEGGLCTVTVEGAVRNHDKEGTSVADASATMCGEYTFGLDDPRIGDARISATYESGNYEGCRPP